MIQRALRPGRRNQSRFALALVLAAGAVLAIPAVAQAGILTPESSGSPNAEKIDLLYTIALCIAAVIFVGVEGILIWSLVKFRFRRGDREPAQIRGNTPLELGWTVGAALVLVVLTVLTFVYLDDIENPVASEPDGLSAAGPGGVQFASIDQPEAPGANALEIGVNGQQYLWRFDYPTPDLPEDEAPAEGQLFTYHTMVVPVNTTVTLNITSQDVVHSWWIPELGGKADAVPGHTNQTWFKVVPPEGWDGEPLVYDGVCAELCGDNHADMRAEVVALAVPEYEQWVEDQAAQIAEAQRLLAVQRRVRELTGAE